MILGAEISRKRRATVQIGEPASLCGAMSNGKEDCPTTEERLVVSAEVLGHVGQDFCEETTLAARPTEDWTKLRWWLKARQPYRRFLFSPFCLIFSAKHLPLTAESALRNEYHY